MSRIGKLPVSVPKGVDVKYDGALLAVKGPNGELKLNVHPDMKIVVDEGEIRVHPLQQLAHQLICGVGHGDYAPSS